MRRATWRSSRPRATSTLQHRPRAARDLHGSAQRARVPHRLPAAGPPPRARRRHLLRDRDRHGAGEIVLTSSSRIRRRRRRTRPARADRRVGGRHVHAARWSDVADDLTRPARAASTGLPDLVYMFTTTEARDVRVSAATPTGESMSWEIRPTCGSTVDAVRCAYGEPASGRSTSSPPAPTSSWSRARATPRSTSSSTSNPRADAPAGGRLVRPAIPLALGVPHDRLADRTGGRRRHDLRLQLPGSSTRSRSPSAATCCRIDAGTAFLTRRSAPTCDGLGDPAPVHRRRAGSQRVRDSRRARTTWWSRSPRASGSRSPVTDSAPDAGSWYRQRHLRHGHVGPATGGFFAGTTRAINDVHGPPRAASWRSRTRRAFRLDLPARRRVVASTEGSTFDTVLHLHNASCRSGADAFCSDDSGGSWSLIHTRRSTPVRTSSWWTATALPRPATTRSRSRSRTRREELLDDFE